MKATLSLTENNAFSRMNTICAAESGGRETTMEKRLYKSKKNKMLDGVCAGIAEYFSIDPTLVRLGAVVLTCAGGSGVLAYIVCAIIIPRDPN